MDDKLDSQDLRQLKQRVGMRCRLDPLGVDELRGYIDRRLELAGASFPSSALFPEETIVAVHVYSRGIPRLVNTLCENALIAGYGRQLRQITSDIIHEVAADLRLGVIARPSQKDSAEKKRRSAAVKALSSMIEDLGDSSSTSKSDWNQK